MRQLLALGLALTACAAAPAPATKHIRATAHDPDHARGALPSLEVRRRELTVVRNSLDTMYAHLQDKLARYQIDEEALFDAADARLAAATTWAAYDSAIYDTLVVFHDAHLSYHPPATAAPAHGYDAYSLGFTTVLGEGSALLVAHVEPGTDAAAAGIAAGDELTLIDGSPTRDALARAVSGRVWSRAESATTDFAHTWTTVLYAQGDPPRARAIGTAAHPNVAIAPRLVSADDRKHKHPVIETTDSGGTPVVTMRSFDGGKQRVTAIDTALSGVRTAAALVIDLRGNRGGVDQVGDRVIAELAEGSATLGSYRVRIAPETLARRPRWKDLTAERDGFSPPQPVVVDGQPPGLGFHGRLAVVVDASCASTCELVASALRTDLHARIFGVTTAGTSGAPVTVTLPGSQGKLAIPTWNLLTADGHPIESAGVTPDVTVFDTPAALAAGTDAPLAAALADVRPPPP